MVTQIADYMYFDRVPRIQSNTSRCKKTMAFHNCGHNIDFDKYFGSHDHFKFSTTKPLSQKGTPLKSKLFLQNPNFGHGFSSKQYVFFSRKLDGPNF